MMTATAADPRMLTPYVDRDSWTGLNTEGTRSKTFGELRVQNKQG